MLNEIFEGGLQPLEESGKPIRRQLPQGMPSHCTYIKNAVLIDVGREHAGHILMAKDYPDEGHAAHAVQTVNHVRIG